MFDQSKMTSLAGAAVALVILVDLATGQGPPVYTNYLQAQQNYRGQPLPPSPSSGLYPQRMEYNPKKHDKEFEKAVELGKLEDSAPNESIHGHDKKLDKFAKKSEKEFKKSEKDFEKSYGKDYEKKEDYASTPAPGMLSSLSSSMSNAWSRFSSLGRSTRSVKNADEKAKEEKRAGKNETDGSSRNSNAGSNTDNPKTPAPTSGRGNDSEEYLQQQRQNGYIYFKVPKYLVCNH